MPPWPIYWFFRKVESFWVIHWCNVAYLFSIAFFFKTKKAPIVRVGEFVWINFPVQCVCSLHPLRSRCANNKQEEEQVCAINQRIEIVTSKKSWRCEGGGVCAERIKYTAKGFVFLGFVLFLHTVLQLYYYIFVQLFIELDSLFPPHNLLNLHRTSFDNFQPKMNLPPNFISKN